MNYILQIFRITKKFWKYYVGISFFIVLISLLNLVSPLLNKNIVDIIVNNVQNNKPDLNSLIFILVLILISDLVITFLTNIAGYLGDILAALLKTNLMNKYYKHVLSLQIGYFDNEQTGKIVSKLQRGIDNITQFINSAANNFLPFFLTALFTVIYLAFYSWEIAILLAVLFPVYIIISDKSSKTWIKRQNDINKINDKQFGRATEVVSSIRVVKSFINEKLESSFFKKKRIEIEALTKVQSRGYHIFDVYRRLFLNIILFAIYAYIIYFTYTGRYTLGEMTLLLQLVTQARFPLFAMSFILSQIQQAVAGSKDFFDVLNEKAEINDLPDAKNIKNVQGNIKFDNVSFNYSTSGKSIDVIKNISFDLKQGEKLAIVGMSGEGKTTLTNLFLRFYEARTGTISIDDQDITKITQNSLHKNIGVVLQDSLLFSGSILENIKYGRPEASDDEVYNAAKAANAHDFILTFDKGYETEIGERGVKLSGGQKQRISIARAILKNAPILVLDEATSSLDSKAELEVQKAINKLMEGKTTMIIAHRLSTIKNVDKIIVLQGGTIAEQGSPEDLAKYSDGIYAELLKLQSLSAKPISSKKLKDFELK
ncbi:MAG: ABC transporter ATP-binding protein [bacterium]